MMHLRRISNVSVLGVLLIALHLLAGGCSQADSRPGSRRVAALTKLESDLCRCKSDAECVRAVQGRIKAWRAAPQPSLTDSERSQIAALEAQIATCTQYATWQLPPVPRDLSLPVECTRLAESIQNLHDCRKVPASQIKPWVDVYSGVITTLATAAALPADQASQQLSIDQEAARSCAESQRTVGDLGRRVCGWTSPTGR